MPNGAWRDLNSKGEILKLHDMCSNKNISCQKQLPFSSRPFELEGGGYKNKLGKTFEGT